MTSLLMLLAGLHVLTGVFWAGSTFTLARPSAPIDLIRRLGLPQIGAAVLAIVTGGTLWRTLHGGDASTGAHVLAAGAAFALLALALQAAAAASARSAGFASEMRLRVLQRIAAAALVLTVLAMATFRYAA
jgi:hypothetical protein